MDTLRRMKKARADSATASPGSGKKAAKAASAASPSKGHFVLSVSSVGVEMPASASASSKSTMPFQPRSLTVTVTRTHNRTVAVSAPAAYEASLRSANAGIAIWMPAFAATVEVSVPAGGWDATAEEEHSQHKDAFVAVENVDAKGKKKLLAKARVDLVEFATAYKENKFRLKLYPETKKVAKCYAEVSILRTDPLSSMPPADLLEDEVSEAPVAALVPPVSMGVGVPWPEGSSHASSASSSVPSRRQSKELLSSSSSQRSSRRQSREVLPPREDRKASSSSSSSPLSSKASSKRNSVVVVEAVAVHAAAAPPLVLSKDAAPAVAVSSVAASVLVREDEVAVTPLRSPEKPAMEAPCTPPAVPKLVMGLPNVAVAKSPSLLQSRMTSEQRDLLAWAKKVLAKYPQIKVTNLTGSWRSGMAFCALIHSSHPNVIPFTELKSQNGANNCKLAFSACQVLGLDVCDVPLSGDLHSAFEDPAFTASCLHALRRSLDAPSGPRPEPEEAELRAWRERWYREAGFFHAEFAATLRSEAISDTSLLGRFEDFNGGGRLSGIENGLSNEMPDTNGTHNDVSLNNNGGDISTTSSTSLTPRKQKVLELIAAAHNSVEAADAAAHQALEDAEDAALGTRKREITDALKAAESDLERFTKKQAELEKQLRANVDDEAMSELLQVVNARNALVRQQMQLNIQLQDNELALRQATIMRQLQALADVDDERKTEVARKREADLMEQYLAIVSDRSALVHQLDTQEQAIADDEETNVESKAVLVGVNANKNKEDCVIQ